MLFPGTLQNCVDRHIHTRSPDSPYGRIVAASVLASSLNSAEIHKWPGSDSPGAAATLATPSRWLKHRSIRGKAVPIYTNGVPPSFHSNSFLMSAIGRNNPRTYAMIRKADTLVGLDVGSRNSRLWRSRASSSKILPTRTEFLEFIQEDRAHIDSLLGAFRIYVHAM